MLQPIHRLTALLLVSLFFTSPLLAQQHRSAAPRRPPATEAPAPTFDTLLAADSYKVYAEVRGVGGLIRSTAVTDLLDPVMKLGGPPKEFDALVQWLNAHADVLAGSRMLIAGWPSRPKLPNVLIAIEFSSPEEARKFYPELRGFLPKLLPTPTPAPTTTQTPAAVPPGPETKPKVPDSSAAGEKHVVANEPAIVTTSPPAPPQGEPTAPLPPYQTSQAGALVFISDVAFTFRNLKPRGSNPLEEDQNFMLARTRFASESIFLYVDLKSIEKEEKEQQRKWEEEEQKRIESEAANPPKSEDTQVAAEAEPTPPTTVEEALPSEPEPSVEAQATVDSQSTLVATPSEPYEPGGTLSSPPRGADEVGPLLSSLYGALFSGGNKWPEAIGAALVFEGDAYVVRTLIINSPENPGNPIPFLPQFVSGPALVPESPNIFPADTNLFVSFSLDYPQIYEGMLKSIAHAEEMARKSGRPSGGQVIKDDASHESPFEVYEKKLGLKIKGDLLPLLGNELALALPRANPKASPVNPTAGIEAPDKATQNKATEPNPVIAIAVKDREAVAKLLPKIIESFGFKGASLIAQTEKRDGTELTSYGNVFAYAFVGDFLIVSPDTAATRHCVDAYLSHQTLSSDSHYRNFTRWQPRQVLGQVYVGPDLMEAYNPLGRGLNEPVNGKMNDFLSRLSPLIEPSTYALTNDGSGPLHELHLPRNLLLWMIGSSLAEVESSGIQADEAAARGLMRTVYSAEATFQAMEGNGRYGNLDELVSSGLISKEALEKYGYRIEVSASGSKFEAIAVPIGYGVTGNLSYFIDETGSLRGGDHGGGAATSADQPVE